MQTTEICEIVSGNDPFKVNTSGFADPWQNFEFFCDLYNSPGSAKAGEIVGSRHTYLKPLPRRGVDNVNVPSHTASKAFLPNYICSSFRIWSKSTRTQQTLANT
jgi:hypothetical protein